MPENIDRSHLQVLLAQAITTRLHEEVVDEILPKPTIEELEKLLDENGRITIDGDPVTMLASGELCKSHRKPVFASDLADAALSAIYSSGFRITVKDDAPRVVLDARVMCRPGDEVLA